MSFGSSIAGLFRFRFVICANSFVDSMWASGLILDLRSWRTSLSHMLGSGLSKSPLVVLGSVFFVCGLSFYLDVVDSHLLLSLAGSVRCDMMPTLVSCELPPGLPPLVLLSHKDQPMAGY